ncbi:MAG: alpha-glucan family phosphorylase [Reyranella sp.]
MSTSEALWPFTRDARIAYFSMEIALESDIPTYSGGLGMLAGDTVRSAADLSIPIVAVTLVSRRGYFRQQLTANGEQSETPDSWEPASRVTPLEAHVAVHIEGRPVWVTGWLYVQACAQGSRVPVILIDSDLPQNGADDRALTHQLYGGDARYRLKQELLLGIGGVRLLSALGFEVRHYHMNEGHSALLTVELLRRFALPARDLRSGDSLYDIPRVREMCTFTTHTPVEVGHDRFPYDLIQDVVGPLVDPDVLRSLAGANELNLTRLALNMSQYINGVAERHAETSRRMFPGYAVHAITNGVHAETWVNAAFAALYDQHVPRWRHEPETLVRAECCVPDDAVWQAHRRAKEQLLADIAGRGVTLDPERPIFGFARRMAAYKRPDLLFADIERLRELARHAPFQLVIAGKAHPHDEPGKALIRVVHERLRSLQAEIPSAYLSNYDMRLAKLLVAGVDVWLNTPQPPLEASGTSGMKAALNGVPSLSVLDGWWVEGCIEGVTGWAIADGEAHAFADDASALYEKLERAVLPAYYGERRAWIAVMKGAIAKCGSLFTSHRMMRRYAVDAYLR